MPQMAVYRFLTWLFLVTISASIILNCGTSKHESTIADPKRHMKGSLSEGKEFPKGSEDPAHNEQHAPELSQILEKPKGNCDAKDISLFGNNASFSDVWGRCARSSWGNVQETSECIKKNDYSALSDTCVSCFGNFAGCGRDNCKWTCLGANESQKCKDCGWQKCGAEWEKCTGVTTDYMAH